MSDDWNKRAGELVLQWRALAACLRREVEHGIAWQLAQESKLSRAEVLESNADQLERLLASQPTEPEQPPTALESEEAENRELAAEEFKRERSQVKRPVVINFPDVVAGNRMDRTIADFVRGCEVAILEEQRRVSPPNHLIALLCDAVRLAREHTAPADFSAAVRALRDIDRIARKPAGDVTDAERATLGLAAIVAGRLRWRLPNTAGEWADYLESADSSTRAEAVMAALDQAERLKG